MFSTSTVPDSRLPKATPATVMIDTSAGRSTCRRITTRSGSPFSRAART